MSEENIIISAVRQKSDVEILHEMILALETRLHELEQWTRSDEDAIYERIKHIENSIVELFEMAGK